MSEITRLLLLVKKGDKVAESRLISVMYDDLKRLAASMLWRNRPNHTLQPTALVNEWYSKVMGGQGVSWQDRAHFFAVAARAMRQILADHARKRKAHKHGGSFQFVALDSREHAGPEREADIADLIAVHEAMERLEEQDWRVYRVVELRIFCELSIEETAEVLGISPRTVKRDWQFGRAWLQAELASRPPEITAS